MPYYDWKCTVCGYKETHLMPMSDSYIDKIECFDCGGNSKKIPSQSSFRLKGGGWFESGYTKN